MHAYPLLLFLISCILSESFQTPSFRLRAVTGFLKLKATGDSTAATESTLTIAEKEREFQSSQIKCMISEIEGVDRRAWLAKVEMGMTNRQFYIAQ